ncbi:MULTISPECIES: biotin--[acetyl-CoA-carboxylase] ligase [unclassified Brevundimonas]|uniref:biotin--[acetyl-CoA-carboxylase] ligase n=1 Tax=unclassified Brevundimonas TaxID=2622653 RepID=UPI000CFB7E48|nr:MULTISPECIES: biotin--[acetyl-CoA-carboxylase] ligase [unclassified Brevundimonas]PRA31990.1 biotin--[acetyl-CoA-carboxylase] ligase [Brevundimonas sp. MYb27]PQZ82730.1 biotin--[acetyl-CoA-carboxylase] ligase [Brevundimonas sp. MYb31]PRB16984.1 biotin--[acetyl-CoA-carboxylase] ligase [Brevundimonas sp. MYb52]PRB37301.1 biotin--[acetyl-CoA-carboxylase] ligase [Brevundimonas sp. MYb46]PRB54805.1 biotin--[acetyl-CoA-carboxylase] ligase [Brevundimonas sp. MYb33]
MAAPVLILDETDSTNAEARRRAEAGEVGPLWITARRQSAGRGRRGRKWESEGGNLFSSLLLLTRKSPAEAAQLTFAASLAVADLLDRYVPPALVRIKWPNDVLLDGRKTSGILIESGPAPTGGLWLAVGIGVNLSQTPGDTERPATCIAEHLGQGIALAPTVDEAAKALAETFGVWLDRWTTLGFQPILDAWIARTPGLHGPCTARLTNETLTGTADGVEADGSLRLKLLDGSLRVISAGDVFFGEAA